MRLNPVLEREMRERVRGPRSVVLLTLFLSLFVFVFATVYEGTLNSRQGQFGALVDPTAVARVGRTSFEVSLFFLLILVLFIVPGLTSSAIAGERERQTLAPMQVTLLRPRAIVLGKVQASLAYLSLLVVASFPVLVICYMVGGVSVADVVRGLLAVLATGVLMACIGVGASAVVRKTQAASALAYAVVLLLCVGTFVAYGLVSVAMNMNRNFPGADERAPVAILWFNPILTTSTVVGGRADTNGGGSADSPFGALRSMISPEAPRQFAMARAVGLPDDVLLPQGQNVPLPPDLVGPNGLAALNGLDVGAAAGVDERNADIRNFGLMSGAIMVGMAALAVALAARRVRTPAETER